MDRHDFTTGESRKLTDLGAVDGGVEPTLHRFESFDGESIPVFLFTFKILVLGIGMFFAIKWHYDKAKREKGPESQRAVLWAAGKVVAVFLLLLVALLFLVFGLGSTLGE